MSYRKEMHFIGRDLQQEPHEFFVLDPQRYRWMFGVRSRGNVSAKLR